MFIEHGCIFENDKILQAETSDNDGSVSTTHSATLRRYSEFFTDFCIQESALVKTDPLLLACSIIACTRKQMNFEVIWAYQLTILTGVEFSQVNEIFNYVDNMYSRSFPESARN